ncbi:MAG: hypothetical protein KIG65_00455 [Eubacteriales bacterium]|nr:hypothetical protein [Eubacteriales bacterium]
MADGSIVFDTELNTDGLNEGLSNLAQSTKGEMKSVSDEVNNELTRSLTEAANNINTRVNSVYANALLASRNYGSESEKITEKKGMSEKAYAKLVKSNLEQIEQMRKEELEALELTYELGIISTQEYFAGLENYRNRYFANGSVEWMKYTAEILKHNKKLAEEQQKALSTAAENTAEEIGEIFEKIGEKREKLSEKLSSYGGISNTNRIIGDDIDIKYTSLSDIDEHNEKLEEYLQLMTNAKSRIDNYWRTDTGDREIDEKNAKLRNDYFSQMRDMSVDEATDFARALSGTGDEKLFEHLEAYEEREALAERISNLLYSGDVADAAQNAAQNLGVDFTAALAEEIDSLSGKFFSSGESACESFGEGFMAELGNVMVELSKAIADGVSGLGYDSILNGSASNVENNTSYNIYNSASPEETIRLLRDREELKRLMIE